MRTQHLKGTTAALLASWLVVTPGTGVRAAAWSTNSPMAEAKEMHAATLLQDGRVLVTGGYNSGFQAVSTSELYDPTNGSWRATASMAEPRYKHTATLLTNGTVLVASGLNSSGSPMTAEIFNPVTEQWTPGGTMATARPGHTATLLQNGKVLVVGGYGSAAASGEVYDPQTGNWTSTGPMSTARTSHSATLLADGTVLVAGGFVDGGAPGTSVELFDPNTGSWTNTGPLNAARYGHQACLLPSTSKVIVTGGQQKSVELYDPATRTWSLTSPLDSKIFQQTLTLLPNGQVLVVGGTSPLCSNDADQYAWLFDPVAEKWTPTAPLHEGRFNHATTLLADGRVMVSGGGSGGLYEPLHLVSVETYTYLDSVALSSLANVPGIGFRFGFKNTQGASFNVLAATNASLSASNWENLGAVIELTPRQFQFTDTSATNLPQRFYRVRVN